MPLRIQVLGLVDLTAHLAPFVGRHAAAAALVLLGVRLLLLLVLLLLGAALVVLVALLVIARIALHLRQAETLGLLLLGLTAEIAIAALLRHCHPAAKDQGARQRGACGATDAPSRPHACLVVVERAIHGVPLPRCQVRR